MLCIMLGATGALAQTTYYSRNDATAPRNWDEADSWTLNSDGSGPAAAIPGRDDNVIILSGHNIIVDNVADNGSAGVSPDGLSDPLVGPFNSSSSLTFYQTGDIIVNDGGTLTTSTRLMVAGDTYVFGSFVIGGDLINLGQMFMTATSDFDSDDDLVLSGNSTTRIDNSMSFTNDDLYMDHPNALLCGDGALEVGVMPNTAEVQFFNGAFEDQICQAFTITGCAVVTGCPGCTSSCPAFDGQGGFTIDLPTGPSLTGTGGTLMYEENAVEPVDPGIVVTFSGSFLLSATAQVTGSFIMAEDSLALIATGGISASYNDTNGLLSLSGYANAATWQAALRNVTYENLSDDPTLTTRTVSFQISDGLTPSNIITRDIEIEAVNDPPDVSTISGSPTPLDYMEGDMDVPVDDQIEIDDPDDDNLEGATISISSNYVEGEDFLDFANAFGVTKVGFDAMTGVLTLTGTSSIANYQMALRAVTYENTSEDPDNSTRTVSFVVNDGDADSDPFDRDINVIPVNDKPTIAGTLTALTYEEDSGPIAIDTGIEVDDVDDVDLEGAVVSIIGNYQASEDFLEFTNQNGITGNVVDEVLTLTGNATLAEYQTALRSVTYKNTNTLNPNTLTRTVRFVINDGDDDSDPFEREINIELRNDAPTISGTVTALDYNEGVGAVVIDNAILVDDEDDTNLEGATIQISNNYEASEDVLAFTNQNGITGNIVGSTLTLAGSATLLDYKNALRSVTYENTNVLNPNTNPRTIRFVITDGDDESMAFERQINIIPENDKAVITGSLSTLLYNEEAGPVQIDGNIEVSDVDDEELEGAVVSITGNYQAGEDVLAFVNQNGITGNLVDEVLTLSGTATLANYETALRSITYENTNTVNPSLLLRTVRFVINDGDDDSDPFEGDIQIQLVNDAPGVTGTLTALNYNEDSGPVPLDPAFIVSDEDDTDLEGATIEISDNFQASEDVLAFVDQNGISGNFTGSTLTLTGTATLANYQIALQSITYENTNTENPSTLQRTVRILITDGEDESTPFEREINIIPENDKPTITGALTALTYQEEAGPVAIDTGIGVDDVDDTNLESAVVSIVTNYQAGEDMLAFTDQNGITGNIVDEVLTLTGSATLAQYQDALRSISYENTNLVNPNTSTRTIRFIVNDGDDDSDPFERDIEIQLVNDAPGITGTLTALNYTEGSGPQLLDNGLVPTDEDDVNLETATITIVSNFNAAEDVLAFTDQNGITGDFTGNTLALTGSATIADYQSALQSITYENTNLLNPSTAVRTVRFTVNDGDDESLLFERDINIIPENDNPTLSGTVAALSYTEGMGPVAIDLALTPADVDDVQLESAVISIIGNYLASEDLLAFTDQNGITGSIVDEVLTLTGTASLADYQVALRSITYENSNTVNPNTNTRTVRFVINDGDGDSGPFQRDITIVPENDPPSVTTTSTDLIYNEGDGPVILDGGITVSDGDDANIESATVMISSNLQAAEDILAFTDQSGITGAFNTGTLTLSGSATLADYQTALRTITYENISMAPSTATRIVSVTINDGDDDSPIATRNIVIVPIVEGSLLTGSGGILDYTEGDGALVVDNGMTITDPDDINLEGARIAVSANYVQGEDELGFTNTASITGAFNSSTGVLTLTGTAPVADYQSAINAVTYLNNSENPSSLVRTVDFSVDDGDILSNAVSRQINVIPVNDNPTPVDDTFTGLEDQDLTGNVLTNDTDPEGDQLTVSTTVQSLPQNGSVALQTDGSFTYTPNNNFFGTDAFSYEVCDNGTPSLCAVAMVTLTIDEVDEPVIVYQAVSPNGDNSNDTWVIQAIDEYPNNNVQIFDRWNALVYQRSGYDNDAQAWAGDANEGLNKGELPDGTYFYIVDLGDGSELLKGFLVLKR